MADAFAALWLDICEEHDRELAIKRDQERRERERQQMLAEREARRKAAIIARVNLAAIERGDRSTH